MGLNDKRISELDEVIGQLPNAVVEIVHGTPLQNYKITPENLLTTTQSFIDLKDEVDGLIASEITEIQVDGVAQPIVSGVVNIPSVQGAKGDKGDDGYTPIKGIDYFDGTQGLQGIQGLKGDKGDTGSQGIQGLKGDKGDKGDTGAQGIQGVAGTNGTNGINGTNGTNGADGLTTSVNGKTQVAGAITLTPSDLGAVATTGNESIAGIKTFTDTTEATTTVDGGTRVSGGLSVAKTVVADNIVAENFKPNVSRGKLRIASSFQSIAVDIRNTGSTTIFTPAAGEEYIIATNLLEIVSWSGTCTSTPSINFYAGGTNQVLNTVSLSTNYDVTTAGAVQLAGSAAPAARRRITNSAPLIINVGTAATGGTITAASVAFVGMLIRVK